MSTRALSIFSIIFLFFAGFVSADQTTLEEEKKTLEKPLKKPLYSPFIERYMLDELRQLRQDQQAMHAGLTDKVAAARLDASDRAIRYTTDTVNNIFFMITAAASILVLLGWRSLRDVKENLAVTVENKISDLTKKYEKRLNELERKLKSRSEQIIATQEKITETNHIHSLWMRAGLGSSSDEKIHVYDQILEVHPDNVEALTHKADVLLDLEEDQWALSLCNQAIEQDPEYALAYWQRACAYAELGDVDLAINDIDIATELSPSLRTKISGEKLFKNLTKNPQFIAMAQDKNA